MKIKILSIATIGFLILACSKERSLNEEQKRVITEFRKSQGMKPNIPFLTAKIKSEFPRMKLDMSKFNGLTPIVYLGDTLEMQSFRNGVKHGPYYNLTHNNQLLNPNGMPDGEYKDGQKHGFFYRYTNYHDIHYIAFYQNDELIWADRYNSYYGELYPRNPFILNQKNLFVEAKHPNGTKWFKGEYKNGHPHGKHKYYYSDGKKSGEIDYRKLEVTQYYYYEGEIDTSSWTFDKGDIM